MYTLICEDCKSKYTRQRNKACLDKKYRCERCRRYISNNKYFSSKKCELKQKQYYLENREKERKRQKEWKQKNSEKWLSYKKLYNNKRRKEDPEYKISINLRVRLWNALKGNYKSGSAVRDLGCSISELKQHLENQFQDGMTWDNYNMHGWHIDHILPLSVFDLTDHEQLKKVCHYTNLQPLWAKDNLSKSDSI